MLNNSSPSILKEDKLLKSLAFLDSNGQIAWNDLSKRFPGKNGSDLYRR